MRLRCRGLVVAAPIALLLGGCEWFTDFKRQPSLSTWEAVNDTVTPSRGNPQFSVPVTGMAVAPFQVSYAGLPGTIDSMAALANPTPVSQASLENGHKYYQINCAVCHGDRGLGDGQATRFGMPGIGLTSDVTRSRTDGYIFGMIRNGRGLMPSYNRIEEPDRWDVVNYLRALQGLTGGQVAVGPLAAPGVTGDKLPGFTRMAPNRQPPHFRPGTVMQEAVPPVIISTEPAAATPPGAAARPVERRPASAAPPADTAAPPVQEVPVP